MDIQQLQQRHDDQRQQNVELRRQLDDMRLIAEDKSTEVELRKANDSLEQLRTQLDCSKKQVNQLNVCATNQ